MDKPRIQWFERAAAAGYAFGADTSVISVRARREDPAATLSTTLACATARFIPVLQTLFEVTPASRLYILRVARPLARINCLHSARGIWGLSDWSDALSYLARSPSDHFVNSDGSWLSGIAEIPRSEIVPLAEYARASSSSLVFVSHENHLSVDDVRALFEAVVGPANVDWARATAIVEDLVDACIRPLGSFDDREAGIDLYTSPALFRSIRARMGATS